MDYDVIIIGSGAGGGSAAYNLAKSGKKVLIIEKGQRLKDPDIIQSEIEMLINRVGYDNRDLQLNKKKSFLYNSGIAGGGSSLYGAVFLRPSPQDFHPGQFYPEYLPDHLKHWPISYEELEPYYHLAEDLYNVCGEKPEAIEHCGRRVSPYATSPPPLEPINKTIKTVLFDDGLSPFHLPLAINFDTCLRCPTCPGYCCPNESRSSSLNRCIDLAMREYGTEMWTGVEAIKFIRGKSNRINTLVYRKSCSTKTDHVSADLFILAAGAIGSPIILQHSKLGSKSDQLGRNYMYHAGVFSAGFFARQTGAASKFIKQLGWTDYYFGTNDFPHKLGYVQMLPIPGPLSIKKEAPVYVPLSLAAFLYKRSIAFAATVEDLPDPNNRVELHNDQVNIHHQFTEYDIFRSKYLKKKMSRLLRKCGASVVVGITSDRNQTHTAHQVGTCRFGNDEKTSVLDKNCRLHDADNLFVLDGRFMPTSLGVGPALTIIANALRVSDYLVKEGF